MKIKVLRLANIFLIFLIILGGAVCLSGWFISIDNLEWGKLIFISGGLEIIGVLGLFGLRENTRINICLLLFVSLSVLSFVNHALLLYDRRNIQKQASAVGVTYDWRDKFEVIIDLQKAGQKAYLVPTPYNFFQYTWNQVSLESFFPLGGRSKKTTVLCNEDGEWAIYKSDRYGYNNNDSVYDIEAPAIVLTGDSFTHGSCVPQEKNIAGALRQKGYKAISLGIAGQGPLLELASLVEYGRFFKPKAVFWCYVDNDLNDLLIERDYPILLKYLASDFSQNLIKKQGLIDSFWDEFSEKRVFESRLIKIKDFLTFSHLRHYLNLAVTSSSRANNKYHIKQKNDVNDQMILLEEILKKAKNLVEEGGGKFYIVKIAHVIKYDDTLSFQFRKLQQIANKLDIPLLDMRRHLEKTGNPSEYFSLKTIGHHYNEKGYELVADLLIKEDLVESLKR